MTTKKKTAKAAAKPAAKDAAITKALREQIDKCHAIERELLLRFEAATLPALWPHRKQQILETLKHRNAYLDLSLNVAENVELLLGQLRGDLEQSIAGNSITALWIKE